MFPKEVEFYWRRANVFRDRVKEEIYSEQVDLQCEYARSQDPVKFPDRLALAYKPLRRGEKWGENWESEEADDIEISDIKTGGDENGQTYILNENTKKFHDPGCSGADDIKKKNKREFTGTRDELIEDGYEPCGRCKP